MQWREHAKGCEKYCIYQWLHKVFGKELDLSRAIVWQLKILNPQKTVREWHLGDLRRDEHKIVLQSKELRDDLDKDWEKNHVSDLCET